MSGNSDYSAILLVALAFGGFIVAAGSTSTNTNQNIEQTINYETSTNQITKERQTLTRMLGCDIWDINNTQASIQALASTYNADTFRLQVYMSQWNTPANKNQIININTWAVAVGLKVIVGCFGTQWMPPEGWDQMKADAVYDAGDKATWLATYTDIINTLQPYGVNCMNEPADVANTSYTGSKTEAQFRIDYKNWVLDCIVAYTAVKANLVFVVENAPFWHLNGMLDAPRIDTSTASPIYYSLHYHYSYSNTDPYTWGWVDAPQRAYWSATTPAQLATAKSLLYNDLLNDRYMQTLVSAGVNVCMDEVGGNILNPNMLVYLQDMFDYAEIYGFSILIHHWGFNDDNTLTSDYTPTLTTMGVVWAANIPVVTALINPTFTGPTLSASSVFIDEPVTCTIDFADAPDPTGTVTFYVSSNAGATWTQYGLATALVAGAATSISYYPSLAGTYLFRVEYSGDGVYNSATSNNAGLTANLETVAPPMLGLLGSVYTQMASYSGIETVSANVCAPGMDIIKSPFKTIMSKMENQT